MDLEKIKELKMYSKKMQKEIARKQKVGIDLTTLEEDFLENNHAGRIEEVIKFHEETKNGSKK